MIAVLFISGTAFFITLLVLPILLGAYIKEPAPKRDVSINSNLWPLTLPDKCFDSRGKRIRFYGFVVLWVSAGIFLLGIV
jgi:hypothetical protein